MKKLLISILLLGGVAHAEYKTLEVNGLYQIYYSSTNDSNQSATAPISTHSFVGTLLSFVIEAVGGDVLFSLSHSTGGYTLNSTTNTTRYEVFAGSSRTLVRGGTSKSFDVRGYVQDPWIRFYNLGSNTTGHITADYLMPLIKSSGAVSGVR